MATRVLFALFLVFSSTIATYMKVIREGDVYLAVVGRFHSASKETLGTCGPVSGRGVQALETALYALDNIESNRTRSARIGVLALDDCGTPGDAALVVTKYLSAAIAPEDGFCSGGDVKARAALRKVVGLISAAYDSSTIGLAMAAQIFHVPLVLTRPSGVDLKGQTFVTGQLLSSAPKPEIKGLAICELVRLFGWTYISIVDEDTSETWAIRMGLLSCLRARRICIASSLKIKRGGTQQEASYIIDELMTYSNAKGVIILAGESETLSILEEVKARGAQGRYRMISGGNWEGDTVEARGLEGVVDGMISLRTMEVEGLKDKITNVISTKSSSIPWTNEYAAQLTNCSIQSGNNLTNSCGESFDQDLIYVSDAVTAMSLGIWKLQKTVCSEGDVCDDMFRGRRPPYYLKSYVKEAAFPDSTSVPPFRFREDGFGRPAFSAAYYTRNEDGVYEWKDIGIFAEYGYLQWKGSVQELSKTFPASVCSQPCAKDERMVRPYDGSCCWICTKA